MASSCLADALIPLPLIQAKIGLPAKKLILLKSKMKTAPKANAAEEEEEESESEEVRTWEFLVGSIDCWE